MVNKILLNDGSTLIDLIIFVKSVNESDIQKIIDKVQENIEDYTNEDIYMALDKELEIKEIIDLSSIKEFYY